MNHPNALQVIWSRFSPSVLLGTKFQRNTKRIYEKIHHEVWETEIGLYTLGYLRALNV